MEHGMDRRTPLCLLVAGWTTGCPVVPASVHDGVVDPEDTDVAADSDGAEDTDAAADTDRPEDTDVAADTDAADTDVGDTDMPGCGRRVVPYTYARPYAPSAAWNTPACGLPTWSESAKYVERFWFYSNHRDADPTVVDPRRGDHVLDFGLDPATDYAPPVYNAADATTVRRVRLRAGWGGTNLGYTDTIPWNPQWRAMEGTDGSMIILDAATGREWNLWGLVQPSQFWGIYNDSQCWLAAGGYSASTDLCVGSGNLVKSPSGQVADYRTYGGTFPSRGVQIQFYAMVVTPEEVVAGEIRHALMMSASNTLFGPACSPAELSTSAAGSTCGFALAPAGGLEWTTPCTSCVPSSLPLDEQRVRSIPEGIRFALDITDAEIESWLDARGYTSVKRSTAKVFVVALRDYGWFITDTGGVAAFSVSGAANPATRQAWIDLGITGSGTDLLFGLLTQDRLRAVIPATNDCAVGGPSPYACPAAATHY